MLTFLGFAMVVAFMYLIMSKRLSSLIALILVPIVFALFGGFASEIGPMMLTGITKLAPTGVMLMFAILYFALMIDSGLFGFIEIRGHSTPLPGRYIQRGDRCWVDDDTGDKMCIEIIEDAA